MGEPVILRVGLHRSLAAADAEIKYALGTLLVVAGFAYHFVWAEASADVDIYYGPFSDPPPRAFISIRAGGLPFSGASGLEPTRLGESEGVPWLDFGEPEPGVRTLPDGRLTFASDIVFAAYWLLTGAREISYARTRWDDLRLAGSAFLALGLAHRPLVSIWGAQLARRFERRGLSPLPSPWAPARSATTFVFTHDVDYPQMIRWIECLRLLRARGPRALSSIAGVVRGTNHFWKFGEWMDFERRLHARSAFYFMARRGSLRQYALGVPDAFYDIHHREFREVFRQLTDEGFEIGLHASFNAYQSVEHFRREKSALEEVAGVTVEGNRHHYWRLDPDAPHETLRRQAAAGLRYDSSLAFEFYPGFRRGICHPFRLFHPGQRRPVDVVELPPAWMDNHFDGRLAENRIADTEAYARSLLDVARATGGVVVVDYHVRGMNADFFPRWGSWLTTFVARHFDGTIAFAKPGDVARQFREYERRLQELSLDDARAGAEQAVALIPRRL
jgi:hypothetical protein